MASESEMPTENLPLLPNEVTAKWVGSKLGRTIKSATLTRSIFSTGSKLFYFIEYEDEVTDTSSRPSHICVKGVFDPDMVKAQPWTLSLAQREADFYAKIAPAIKHMGHPKAWWGGRNDRQGIAIMSDLVHEGCTFPPETTSYPLETVLEEYLMDGARIREVQKKYYARRNPKFRTLLHGDPHMGNTYFTADGHIRFLDWSAIHFASCFHDLVYFVSTTMTVKDRQIHEMEILDYYLSTLHKLGGPKLDRNDEELMIEYKKSYLTNLIWPVCGYALQTKERVDVLAERTIAAWVDHKVIEVVEAQP
ncbi:hypothetical protein Daesc_008845 [Daldinia eschscholtzii]|uniref:CHK kinase-like domain-containing protein n=1 Tax=Daldinia eschscholtzii TaxID=292717 RepID=A0AAX6MDR4_9PEZI